MLPFLNNIMLQVALRRAYRIKILVLLAFVEWTWVANAQSIDSIATRIAAWPTPQDTTTHVGATEVVQTASFKSSSLYGSLSASYAASQNWGGQDLKNYAFMGNLLYRHSLFAGTRSHMHQLMVDVGYLKFVDSVWVKNMDRLQTNFLWSSTGNRFNRSYTIAFGTQFLPYTFLAYDIEQN